MAGHYPSQKDNFSSVSGARITSTGIPAFVGIEGHILQINSKSNYFFNYTCFFSRNDMDLIAVRAGCTFTGSKKTKMIQILRHKKDFTAFQAA